MPLNQITPLVGIPLSQIWGPLVLSGDATTQAWLADIMAPHYGVLMYAPRRGPRRHRPPGRGARAIVGRSCPVTARPGPLCLSRGSTVIAVSRRFWAIQMVSQPTLPRPARWSTRWPQRWAGQDYVAGSGYSLADCFATACLARLTIHGFFRLVVGWPGCGVLRADEGAPQLCGRRRDRSGQRTRPVRKPRSGRRSRKRDVQKRLDRRGAGARHDTPKLLIALQHDQRRPPRDFSNAAKVWTFYRRPSQPEQN